MHDCYQAWKTEIASRGSVIFKLNHEILRVVSRCSKSKDGAVQIEYKISTDSPDIEPQTSYFDEIIFAIDADSCLKILGKEATFMEQRVLGNVKYLYDVTITHSDLAYMKKVSIA